MTGFNSRLWRKKQEYFAPTTTPYPHDDHPRLIREAVECASVRHQLSPALYSAVADAAASLAVQGLAVLKLPDGSVMPLNMYFLIIAMSGMGKTRAFNTFFKSFLALDKTALAEFMKDDGDYPERLNGWKVKCCDINKMIRNKRTKGEPHDHLQGELDTLVAKKPIKPRYWNWLLSDATAPAFLKRIAGINKSVALASHEATKLFKHLYTLFGDLCSLWDDGQTDSHRIGSGTKASFESRIMMLLLTQPSVFYDFCAGQGGLALGMGFWARCLVTVPCKPKGHLTSDDKLDATTVPLDAFLARIDALITERIRRVKAGITEPDIVELDADANDCWIKFGKEMKDRSAENGDLSDVSEFADKAAVHAAHHAAVFAYFCGDTKVTLDTMERAIRIIRYHLDAYRDQFSLTNAVPQVALDAVKLETFFRRLYLETRGTNVTLDSLHHSNTSSDLKLDKNLLPALIYMEQKGKIQFIRPNSGKSYVNFRNLVSMPS
jgi:hypothetical protein